MEHCSMIIANKINYSGLIIINTNYELLTATKREVTLLSLTKTIVVHSTITSAYALNKPYF